jgi:hypothetical protein
VSFLYILQIEQILINSSNSCESGLAGVHETTEILGHLVSLDAIKLLTGNGQPINNANIEEIIKIAAKVSAVL